MDHDPGKADIEAEIAAGAEREDFRTLAGVRKSPRNEPADRLIKLNGGGGSNRQFVLTSQFGAMVEQLLAEYLRSSAISA